MLSNTFSDLEPDGREFNITEQGNMSEINPGRGKLYIQIKKKQQQIIIAIVSILAFLACCVIMNAAFSSFTCL